LLHIIFFLGLIYFNACKDKQNLEEKGEIII